ncbi:tetratricopeptide repeat protein [Limibacter armeniacum]|uniref:tetratricopeptide repeat protein n=1 Tax=Limibacter armeniacum TaxID=466084 RepID=UPI002FE568FD
MRYTKLIILAFLVLISCKKEKQDMDALINLREQTDEFYRRQIAFMNDVIDDEPDNARYYYLRSRLHEANGEISAALSDIETSLKRDSTNARYYFLKARMLFQREALTEALSAAQRAGELGFREPELYSLIGSCYYEKGENKKALEYLRIAQQIVPDDAITLFSIGAVYAADNDTTRAMKYLRESVGKKKDYTKAYTRLMDLYNNFGKPRSALRYGAVAIENCAPHVGLYTEMGRALESTGLADSAMFWYDKAFALDDTYWKVAKKLGDFYRKKKQPEVAEGYYRKVIAEHPDQKDAYYELGMTYEYWYKKHEEAKEFYTKAVELDSTFTDGQVALQRVEKALRWQDYIRRNPEVLEQMQREKEEQKEQEEKRKLLERLSAPMEKVGVQ